MKNSVLGLLIALFAFGTSLSQIGPVYAAENDFTFTIGSNGVTVKDYGGTDLNVVIPGTYEGMEVTEIGRSAFDTYGTGKPKITSVVIPNSVKVIQTYGFRYTNLTSIDLPDSLLTIGASAFENNPLTTIVFPDSVTAIGNYSFYMNSLTSIKLSENLKTINGGAFDTNHITKLVIPAGVTNVASSSFYRNSLTSVTVLGNATTFGTNVFADNPGNLKIFGIANSPAAAYAPSNGHTFVDGTELFKGVASAKSLLKSHHPGNGVGQVPANTYNDLSAAYDAAMLFIDGIGNATVASDLADAAIPLTSSIEAFNAQIIQAGNPAGLVATITSAQQALTDHPEGVNVGQASAGDRSALQNAIAAAQQIFNQADKYRQDELELAVANLETAIDTFDDMIITAGDPTALGAAFTSAQQALTDHPEGVNVGQASAGTRTALQTASNAAQQILNTSSSYTQNQLDTAVGQLNLAVQVFNAAVIQPGIPTALGAAITAAQQALSDHPEGVNVGQTSAETRDALETAIDSAQQILNTASSYTQDQLDTAVGQLNSAVQVFNAAVIQPGIPTALGAAITAAQQALTDHPEGTDVGQTSADHRAALQTASNAAQQILNNASSYTQNQLDTAVGQLDSAVQVFNAAVIQPGIPTALGAAITAAQQALSDHPEGTDVGQTSAETRDALETAIDTAQQIVDNANNYTQIQLDTAVGQLNSAVQVFNAAVIQPGIPTALSAAITAAHQALSDHTEGVNVGQTSAETRDALETAIDTAQQIVDNANNYTQDQLDTAVGQLNSAVQVFNAAVIQPGIPTALGAAITAAHQAMSDHPEGTDVGQTSADHRAALQTAIDAAQAIADHAENQSQTRLDVAAARLNEALAEFEAAWVGVALTASANDLYGTSDTIRFTVFYGYEVTVTGTPVVPIMVGDGSVTQTVYAPYTGARGTALTKLTFEYEVPAGLADVDGIEVAAALELPNDANIVRASGGAAALLTYEAPDTSGIRIVAIPPDVTLTVAPNGLARKAISVTASVYGVAAGNAMKELRWLPGSLKEADFASGTKGTDILVAPQFTITANGDYTVYARDEAGNESVKVISVTGISTSSSSAVVDRPITSETTVKINPHGGITALVDPSDIKQVTRSDGTVIEQVILSERTRERVLELLKDAKEPFVSIEIGDREQAVQTRFPADWIADMAKAYPNAIIEVRLNDSSFQLRISAINLTGLAERLDAEVSNLTVSIIQEQAGEDVRQEIDRIGVSQGFAVFADVIDYKVTAEANEHTLEVRDFGGSYLMRTIKLDGEKTNRNLVAVQYIPAKGTVVFVPAQLGTGPDGTTEAILNVPHNSLYTVVDVQARTFADLNGYWAKADVEHLASKLLVNGVAADRFGPEGTITRAEFSALLVRGLGLSVKESAGGARFADVPASVWYSSAVDAAVASGLMSGIGADRFAPNDPITREQMAVVIGGALTFTGHKTSGDGQEGGRLAAFMDRDSISSWAQAAVVRVLETGIIKGMKDGRFAPTEYATRAQAAVMLKRFLQYVHFID
ncbi:S-layer homology domain-containing protein [Cohnella herbarum]|uniref:Leucine-rich repeat protein n=1 Tax=Cohnella herbarum TaxID=2728023 RepID=A0A7Z2VH02_9BACL|nr:S-layer homology domain-containing protein [Cohnella herbarum]QJD82740.1 leucine-rich repeat protein [Cohnella herbarum]